MSLWKIHKKQMNVTILFVYIYIMQIAQILSEICCFTCWISIRKSRNFFCGKKFDYIRTSCLKWGSVWRSVALCMPSLALVVKLYPLKNKRRTEPLQLVTAHPDFIYIFGFDCLQIIASTIIWLIYRFVRPGSGDSLRLSAPYL